MAARGYNIVFEVKKYRLAWLHEGFHSIELMKTQLRRFKEIEILEFWIKVWKISW